jgi:hypothetical protein
MNVSFPVRGFGWQADEASMSWNILFITWGVCAVVPKRNETITIVAFASYEVEVLCRGSWLFSFSRFVTWRDSTAN